MKKNTLFIGNSHTYLHYMPQMLLELVKAEDRGFTLSVDQITGEGASLQWHWQNVSTLQKIRSKRWDFVVLQERSGGPLEELRSFQRHARKLDEVIRKQGAKTIFYLTWANKSRSQTQETIAYAYKQIAKKLGAGLAPVGLAWIKAQTLDSELNLHHKDGRHANPIGSYLTACVFYAVLFNASPEGLPAALFIKGRMRPTQDEAQALFLQKVAWETVLNWER